MIEEIETYIAALERENIALNKIIKNQQHHIKALQKDAGKKCITWRCLKYDENERYKTRIPKTTQICSKIK